MATANRATYLDSVPHVGRFWAYEVTGPIGTFLVHLVGIDNPVILVRGLDCLNGTPLLDLKPDRPLFQPIASPQQSDFQTGDP